MKKSTFLIIVVGLMILAVLIIRLTGWGNIRVAQAPANESLENSSLTPPATVTPPATPVASSTGSTPITPTADVIISSPTADQVVVSPLLVVGQAKGNWFFEGSLPVRLMNSAGVIIGITPGQAQGEWMTQAYVPFTAKLEFTTNATSGFLLIARDNPSGLPKHDATIKFPVKFK